MRWLSFVAREIGIEYTLAPSLSSTDIMSDSYYRTAQICLNGHVSTPSVELSPEGGSKFCVECGARTINACPKCEARIRGFHIAPGILAVENYEKPSFCHDCGTAYPWTQSALEAARELAEDAENLDPEERAALARSFDDLIVDTPRTQVAISRFKRLIAKAGVGTANGIREILIDIASETAKRALFPSQ